MHDPFRPNSNKQLIREAQIGFTVIGMLVALLIYVAWFRINGSEFQLADDSSRPSDRQVTTDSKIASPLNRTDNQLSTQSTDATDATRTLQQLDGTAKSIGEVAETVELLISDNTDSARPIDQVNSKPLAKIDSASTHSFEGSLKHTASRIASLPPLKRKTKPISTPFLEANSNLKTTANANAKPTANANAKPLFASNLKLASRSENLPSDTNTTSSTPSSDSPTRSGFVAKPTTFIAPKLERPETTFRAPGIASRDTVKKETEQPDAQRSNSFQPADPNPKSASRVELEPSQSPQVPALQKPETDPNTLPTSSNSSSETKVKTVAFEEPIEYEIKEGDSYWWIAKTHYDNGQFFRALYSHNKEQVPGFEDLKPGTKIEIPSRSELIRLWPVDIPLHVLRENDAWRKTPEKMLDKLTEECDRELESRFYETREGDTLFLIAGQQLGQASRYVELIELNQFRLPSGAGHQSPLPEGLRLILPE